MPKPKSAAAKKAMAERGTFKVEDEHGLRPAILAGSVGGGRAVQRHAEALSGCLGSAAAGLRHADHSGAVRAAWWPIWMKP
jgi:hypothetical protein